jgi:hypothetical protein
LEAVRVCPTVATPVIVGTEVEAGGCEAATFETTAVTLALTLWPLPGVGYAVTVKVCDPSASALVSSVLPSPLKV